MAQGEKILFSDLIQQGDPFEKATAGATKLMTAIIALSKEAKNIPFSNGKGENINKYAQEVSTLEAFLKEYKKTVDDTTKTQIKLNEVIQGKTKILEEEKARLAQVNRETKLNAESATAAKGSYAALNAEYKKNLNEVKNMQVTNEKERKARDELIKVTNKQNAELKKLDAQMGNHQRNVGNYSSALDGLTGQFGFMGGAINTARGALTFLSNGFRTLGTAIASTGIGLLLVALSSMIAYFKEAGNSVLMFNESLQAAKAGWKTFTETMEKTGEGFWDWFTGGTAGLVIGSQKIVKAFSEIGSEYKKQAQVQAALAPLINNFNKTHIENLTKIADLEAKKREAMRLATEEETLSIEERVKHQTAAKKLTEQIFALKTLEQQLTVSIANQKYISDENIETLEELEKAKADLIMLGAQEDEELKALNKKYNALTNALEENKKAAEEAAKTRLDWIQKEDTAFNKALKDQQKADEEKRLKSIELAAWASQTIADIEKKASDDLNAMLDADLEAEMKRFDEREKAEDDLNNKRIQNAMELLDFTQMVGDWMYQMNSDNIQAELADAQKLHDQQLKLAGDSAKGRAAADAQYAAKEKELKRKQAKANKEQSIFQGTIALAQAVIQATTAGPGLGLILAILTAAFNAVYLAKIIATPIPSFRKGTKRLLPDGRSADKDGVTIQAHKDERILTAEQNKKIGFGIENNQIPGLVTLGQKYKSEFPILAAIAEKQFEEQRKTNGLLRKWGYVDRNGNFVTIEGNKVNYV
jgi:hypothetical protein